MISSKKELKFYIMADYMMNRGKFKPSKLESLFKFFIGGGVMSYLVAMRKYSYYKGTRSILKYYYRYRYYSLGKQLGFSIGADVFGYGLVIPHYGTIIAGNSNRCGNYCVLQVDTVISDNGKRIGDALYLSVGAKMTSKVTIGDNVSVGANSVVNKSFEEGNMMIAGAPAKYIKAEKPWYERDGKEFVEKVNAVEKLKSEFFK